MNSEPQDPERLDLPSASAMYIVQACPGQPNLKRIIPPETKQGQDKEQADSGTRIHLAFETGNTLDLSEEEAATYELGVKFNEEIVKRWMYVNDIKPEEMEEGPRELRIWLHDPHRWPELLGSGKLDRHYISRKHRKAIAIDLKSGWNPNLPPSRNSWQGRFQALLLWKEEYEGEIDEVWFAHCKPQSKAGADDYCTYIAQDLQYSLDSILFHLWESTQEDAQRRAGEHCRYCPCKAHCPEAIAYALLPSVIASMAAPQSFKPEDMVGKVAHEDLLKLWDMSTVVGQIIEAADARLKTLPKAELDRLGLELPEQGRSRDTVIDVPGAFLFLRDAQGFSEEKLWGILRLTKGDVAKLAMAEKQLAKKWADKWSTDTLAPFSKRTHDQPSLRRIKGM